MTTADETERSSRSRSKSEVSERELMAALPKRSAGREVRVGLFVLIGIVAFLTALFTLTDVGTFRGRYYVTTVVETAGGMRRGDPVQMRGVNIGRVSDFEMVPGGVEVLMEIYNQYPIPEDSRVAISSAGLLGGMLVDIQPGSSDTRADREEPLEGIVEGDILSSAGGLTEQAEEVLGRAGLLLSRDNIGSVGTSVSELETLLADLSALASQQRQELATLTQSLQQSAAGVERATSGPELEQAVQNAQSATARLDAASESLGRASTSLETVLSRIERGEGTLGRMTTDESLYENLDGAAASVRALAEDIQANPGRYIDVSVF